MKLILISSLVPVADPKSGFDIANRIIAEALLQLGIDLQIIGFVTPGQKPAYPDRTVSLGELEVTNANVGRLQKTKWLARSVVTGLPVSAAKMHAASLDQMRAALIQTGPADGFVLNSVQLAAAFEDLFIDKKSLYVSHNIEWQSALRNAALSDRRFVKFMYERDARLLKDVEERLCQRAAHVFCLADNDRTELPVFDKSTTLPLLTRSEYLSERQHAAYQIAPEGSDAAGWVQNSPNCDVGLIGSWSWASNRHGLMWFLDCIVPKLPTDFSIRVAGLLNGALANCPPNVTFLGRVPSAERFVKQCRVIPLISREGTGIQLKTLETFEFGLPSVATRSSVRGIEHIPPNCILADNDEDYAKALVELVFSSRATGSKIHNGATFIHTQRQLLFSSLVNGLEMAGFELPKGQDAA